MVSGLRDYDRDTNYSDGLKIVNSRIRNNLADGVNFCQEQVIAAVYNCSRRTMVMTVLQCGITIIIQRMKKNVFAYNTIEFN